MEAAVAHVCTGSVAQLLGAQQPLAADQSAAPTCSSCSICASCAALLAGSRGVMGRWRNGTPKRLATTSRSAQQGEW